MIRILASLTLFVTLAFTVGCAPQPVLKDQVTLVFAGGSVGEELDLTLSALSRFMEANPGIKVHVRPTPNTDAERFQMYLDLLESGSPDVDVYQIDVVWTRTMAPHALDLASVVDQTEIKKHFDTIIRNNTVDGKLVGLPWFGDAPVLYYRKDLLAKYGYESPPATWDELEAAARSIQDGERQAGNLGFWGYLWQGNAYEGLTCNALEWQASQGGGNFIDSDGNPNLTNPRAVEAFRRAAAWVGTISPPRVVEWDEAESRVTWLKGDAAFMRNWPISYAITKNSAMGDKFDVATMPRGEGGTAAVLGGWQLMVSGYSQNAEAAVKLVRFMTSDAEQRQRAIEGSYIPTIRTLYSDPEVLAAVPFFEGFDETLQSAVSRPSQMTDSYSKISESYWSAVHNILTGGDPMEELEEGTKRIEGVLGR